MACIRRRYEPRGGSSPPRAAQHGNTQPNTNKRDTKKRLLMYCSTCWTDNQPFCKATCLFSIPSSARFVQGPRRHAAPHLCRCDDDWQRGSQRAYVNGLRHPRLRAVYVRLLLSMPLYTQLPRFALAIAPEGRWKDSNFLRNQLICTSGEERMWRAWCFDRWPRVHMIAGQGTGDQHACSAELHLPLQCTVGGACRMHMF